MHSEFFYYPIIIKEQYLDTFGHVNNATYLSLFEEARWEIVTKNGYGLKKIKETGLGPVILEIKIHFFKELLLREKIVIETQFVSYEKKIGSIHQRMLRGEEVCCLADFKIALFDLKERKLVLPTKEWLNAVGIQEN